MKSPALHNCWLVTLFVLSGCWSAGKDEVVVATALDAEFSQPILDDFNQETGLTALPRFDTEATKTVGLTNAIIAEADRPRTDVFWNNEILNTLRLERKGLLQSYTPPLADEYPEMYRSPDGTWHGFAARARILIVNTDKLPPEERPRSLLELTEPKWKGKVGIAKPLFGTTATHAACLFAAWGDDKAKEYFRQLKANDVQILAGNKQVALAVSAADGGVVVGLTDTDDAMVEIEQGRPVEIIYPDREPDQMGTLFIPNTLAILKDCPHPEAARQLVDYLLRPETEAKLARGASAQIPLHPEAKVDVRVETPQTVKAFQVDFEKAADKWEAAAKFTRDEFATAN